MRGIISWGTHLPHWRLDRTTIAAVAGQGGGRGTRTVAGFDQDTTTLGVEAAREALTDARRLPDQLLFATVAPAYADKTNATTVHAAVGLPASTAAWDLGGSVRSAVGGVVMAARSQASTLVVTADVRTGRAGSADEAAGGDAAAAVLVADDHPDSPVVAEIVATASATGELVDRWRIPGETVSRTWDEKFAEVAYRPLVAEAFAAALADAGLDAADVDVAVVAAPSARMGATVAKKLGVARVADDLSATVGITGAAHPLLCLAAELERMAGDPDTPPGQVIALVHVGDGADVVVLRTTGALAGHRPPSTVAEQMATGGPVTYGRFLSWRGMIDVEPPRRPEPSRVSAPAAWRAGAWKFGFTGSRDPLTDTVQLPPSRVSADGQRTDTMEPAPLAAAVGTVATFTVDRVAYSPSPPIIFAVVDFDGGGRFPVELCDLTADEVAIGSRVVLTFRRLHAADGIPNYFWKARLVRPVPASSDPSNTAGPTNAGPGRNH
jgi:hydroxymethylglutaryl-CoA synthase